TPRVFAYIDGLNLYYGAVKKTPYRWLNLKAFVEAILPSIYRIIRVNYYTAPVSHIVDPGAPKRQKILFDALKTVPEIEIHKGRMAPRTKRGTLVEPPHTLVTIRALEEKGSDVNLASHLVRDAFQGSFDVAAVVTNDTDLVEPIRIVTQETCLPVILICPNVYARRPVAASLKEVATEVRRAREGHLVVAQFPDVIPGTNIKKPSGW
ncbi:MAG: NYN domain-containing protein, partial [bacterium]